MVTLFGSLALSIGSNIGCDEFRWIMAAAPVLSGLECFDPSVNISVCEGCWLMYSWNSEVISAGI